MGRITTFRDLVGVIKDKISLSKAALLSKPNTHSLHLAVLRATTHSSAEPPDDHRLYSLLTLGHSSRATASALVSSLMDRLHRTGNASVALKCLLTIHHILKWGPFILQDQLSIFPSAGGRNYLKLSGFRDCATAATWALSEWVRWYARYLETLLSASRNLGFILCSEAGTSEKDKRDESISSSMNFDLIKDVDSLVGVIEEICKVPDYSSLRIECNKLLFEIMGLLNSDYFLAVDEILVRLSEFKERLGCLGFAESVELVCGLRRLEDCKERLSVLFTIQKPSMKMLWELNGELKDKAGISNVYGGGGNMLTMGSESARFGGERVRKTNDSLNFSSGRLH